VVLRGATQVHTFKVGVQSMLVESGIFSSAIASACTIAVGIAHISNIIDLTCESSSILSNYNCIGPYLAWNTNSFTADINRPWRAVFSLEPNRMLDNFSPLIFGILCLSVQFQGGIQLDWWQLSFLLLMCSLFTCFGYAGNLGIICGFLNAFASLLGLILAMTYVNAPNSLGITICSVLSTKNHHAVPSIGILLITCSSILTLICGFIVAIGAMPDGCNVDCVGPGLNWNTGEEAFITNSNNSWRSVFSLTPVVIANIWTPLIAGVVGLLALFGRIRILFHTWTRAAWWHLFQALFLNFGFAGNWGIITGFVSLMTCLVCFICAKVAGFEPAVGILSCPQSVAGPAKRISKSPTPMRGKNSENQTDKSWNTGIFVNKNKQEKEANRGKVTKPYKTDASISKFNMGSVGYMDQNKETPVYQTNRGTFSGSSHVDSGVSRMNMGSAGIIDTNSSPVMTESNRGAYGTKSHVHLDGGSTKSVDRGPNSKYGVLRKMPWDK